MALTGRQKQMTKQTTSKEIKSKTKPTEEIYELKSNDLIHKILENTATAENVLQVASQMSETDRKVLVDFALHCYEQKQHYESMLKTAKEILMTYGHENDKKNLSTLTTSCIIGPASNTVTGTPTELVKLLKKMGKTELADTILSVKIGEAKKYLGQAMLEAEGFLKTVTEEFGKITIKQKK